MVRRWAVAVSLACGAGGMAQPWPAVPAGQPAAEPVYLIRTAGQTDRTVKVVFPADPADPMSMAEVMDTATKKTFQIPGKVLAKLPKVGATGTEPAPQIEVKPTHTPPPELPPVPVTAQRTSPHTPVPVTVPPTAERMVTTWTADDPPATIAPAVPAPQPAPTLPPAPVLPAAPSPVVQSAAVVPSAAKPLAVDPWRATGEPKAVAPTPRPQPVGPTLTPVPTWRATPAPTPPGVVDPWRASGG
jgi:hypothetical protein